MRRTTSDEIRTRSRILQELDPPIPMLILERGLRIRWVSSAAIDEFRIREDLLVGRSWYELFPESAARREIHEELFQGLRTSLDIPRVPLRISCAAPRYFSLRLSPIVSEDGSVEAVLGVGADVTSQIDAERTLRESERRLEVSLWSSKAAYWVIDVTRDRAEMSPQFFELTAIDERDWNAIPNPWNTRMHPADRPRTRRIYEDYVAGRLPFYECEYRLDTPRGWLWMHDRGRAVDRDASGRILKMAGTTQDASARKELEDAITESADRERRRISYDLHDELGQELSGAQYLLSSVLNAMRQNHDTNTETIAQVLALVRRTIGTARRIAHGLEPVSVSPDGLRSALVTLARESSEAFGMRVSVDCNELDGNEISSMAAQSLFRITQEALTNARRHGDASEARIAVRQAADSVTLTITDNGHGIKTPPPARAGIGLRIMGHRAQNVGGTFTIGPEPSGGTRVTVTCPTNTPLAAAPGAQDTAG